jgi:hypothetical protein
VLFSTGYLTVLTSALSSTQASTYTLANSSPVTETAALQTLLGSNTYSTTFNDNTNNGGTVQFTESASHFLLKEVANLKEALANVEHQLDAFEARVGYQPEASQPPCLASTDPQIAFANDVVAALENRLTEDRAMVGMRRGELSQHRSTRLSITPEARLFGSLASRGRRPAAAVALGSLPARTASPLAGRELFL